MKGAFKIKSMTGYGRVSNIINDREITVEIKSVNHRYLDLSIKTPRIYGFLDEYIKKEMIITRGKVDVYITIDSSKSSDTKIEIDENLLQEYLKVLRDTCQKYNIEDDIKISNITKLPDVLSVKKEEADATKLAEDVVIVLKEAVLQYEKMREFEGQSLKNDILSRNNEILKLVEIIEESSPQTVIAYQKRLFAKLQEVLSNNSISEDRILAESAVFADKVSVCEETVRLKSHIMQFEQMCDTEGAIGRKMDFLIQEFNREANTIGSKANDSAIAKIVIDLKSEIEKIREQVQNVE
ncbi:MAG: YicC/YloC family endoribonuclease [Clostridia bacterium]